MNKSQLEAEVARLTEERGGDYQRLDLAAAQVKSMGQELDQQHEYIRRLLEAGVTVATLRALVAEMRKCLNRQDKVEGAYAALALTEEEMLKRLEEK